MKIYITGASGSGTTTVGKLLSEELCIPHYDNDDIFWRHTEVPFSEKRSVEKRKEMLREIINREDHWIFTGSALKWGDLILLNSDLIIWLSCNSDVRIERLKKRESDRFGDRILPEGDMYENHLAFLDWAKKYDSGGLDMRSKQAEELWMQNADCDIIRLENTDSEMTVRRVLKHVDEKKPVS